MKYLVIGDNNGLGLEVLKALENAGIKELSYFGDGEFDVFDKAALNTYVESYKPDVIIDLYEDNDIEKAEQNEFTELRCYRINANSSKNLVEAAEKVGAKFVYLSTDFVYSGNKNNYNKEKDTRDTPSIYGACKIATEKEVERYNKYFIVRPGMVYGGTVDYISELLNDNSPVKEAPKDEIISPTNISTLAKYIVDLSLTDKYGIYNVADSGACSKKEFAETIGNIFRRNYVVENVKLDYYVPANRALSTDKLVENGFDKPEFWIPKLVSYCKEYSKNNKVLKKD